ncbi:MAG TPA: sulfotransferase [Sphingomicrobium sp.]|nr:sulfotransferase [Sphingomicrobium sp.]
MAEEKWQALLANASQLRRSGRISDAIVAYRALLAVNPDLPDSWYNLAWLQKQARQFDEALSSYQQAIDRDVRSPEEVHLNRAVILSDHLHRPEEAEGELRAALVANPTYIPALLNLGNLREDRGDRDGAREAYQRALAIEPVNSLALARLAGVSTDSQGAELADRLRTALAREDLSAADRADLGFSLAALLDASGSYDEAFERTRDANLASREAGGSRAIYDRSAHEQFVDQLIGTFDRPATGELVQAPVFICGMFRSGSTLIEQVLGAHSRVTPGGELDLVPALVAQVPDYPAAVAAEDSAAIKRWRKTYCAGLPAIPEKDRVVTDKRPDNFLHIGLIKTIFPTARIIHTRRDPLDNLLSLYFLHLHPDMAYALDLEDAAHWYGQYRRLMNHWKTLYPNDIFDVDYDELVHDPGQVVNELLGFLGLEWEDGLLDFHRTSSPVKTASVWQVRQPLHSRSSGRWRNYRKRLAPIRKLLDEP